VNWDWSRLIEARVSDGELAVYLGPLAWLVLVLIFAVWVVSQRPWQLLRRRWRVVRISPMFFGTRWYIERDRQTAMLAHEAYVELITRKAALEFEEDDDVLTEIYDSWYALFGEIRRLARQIDADEIATNADLRRLHDLLIAVLNQGLRPHLTRWQAKFRRWYATQSEERPVASPQDIQRAYPEYEDLVASLRDANGLLIELASELKRLSHGESTP